MNNNKIEYIKWLKELNEEYIKEPNISDSARELYQSRIDDCNKQLNESGVE